jgi:hypothetical protein
MRAKIQFESKRDAMCNTLEILEVQSISVSFVILNAAKNLIYNQKRDPSLPARLRHSGGRSG